MKITIDVHPDEIDRVILDSLKSQLDILNSFLCMSEERTPVFDTDFDKDNKEIKKRIKAFKKVIDYYS